MNRARMDRGIATDALPALAVYGALADSTVSGDRAMKTAVIVPHPIYMSKGTPAPVARIRCSSPEISRQDACNTRRSV